MTGRLERESLRKKVKTYSATMILFKKTEDWDKDKEPDPTLHLPTKKEDETLGVTQKEAEDFKKEMKKIHFQDLRQFYIGTFDIRLDGVDLKWLQAVHEKLIRKDAVLRVTKKGKELPDPTF